jgi:hypothetical protein
MDRELPFPSGKVQQMGASGRALLGFQAGPHSSLPFFDGVDPAFKMAPRLRTSPKA